MKQIFGNLMISALLPCMVLGAARVSLRIPELGGVERNEIATGGVPLPKGMLADPADCRLLDSGQRELPMETTVLTRWPDGSVKWLLLDFEVSIRAGEEARYFLETGVRPAPREREHSVEVAEDADFISVDTGALSFRVGKKSGAFIEDVRLADGERIIPPGASASVFQIETTPPGPPEAENWLRDAAGGERGVFGAHVAGAEVEFANALRTVILVHGEYRDAEGLSIGPFKTRYTAWAGFGTVGMERFFAFDADVDKAFPRALSFEMPLGGVSSPEARFGIGEAGAFAVGAAAREAALVEVMPDRFYHLVPLSEDRRVRYEMVVSEGAAERVAASGVEADGWVSVSGENGGFTIATRDFARQHPKEISVDKESGVLRYYIWPERGGKVLDLRRRYKGQISEGQYDTGEYGPAGRGFGKTHQFLVEFGNEGLDAARSAALSRRADEPLRIFCEPEHYAASDIWNSFHPVDNERFPQTEGLIRLGIEWMLSLPRKFHWDGMVDWGDTLFHGYESAPHAQETEVPPTSWVVRGYDGWLNNDCNVAHDILIFFLRSGDHRIFRYWERMVRHIMDVDTIHAAEDPRHIGGGRRHDQQHWGSTYTGYGTAAVEAGEKYLLTGSQWAREMAIRYADWYMVSGGAEWETRLPCLVLAWEITGDPKYMDFIRAPHMERDPYGLKLGTRGTLSDPHWRTPGVELGVDFLHRATGEEKWAEHFMRAARMFVDTNPGNGYGRSLIAKAAMLSGDQRILDWMRRLELVASPYTRARKQEFFESGTIPLDLSSMPWDDLAKLAKKANMIDVRSLVYDYRGAPYVMAALAGAGLDESGAELADFVLDRRGQGQYSLRGRDIPDLESAHYRPVSLESAANANPLADPFAQYAAWKREPAGADEIGFDFGDWGETEPGFLPVRPTMVYPYIARRPGPAEHDGVNLIGLPFGASWRANNIWFSLPDPALADKGETMLIVEKGATAEISLNITARRLYVLGHVTRSASNLESVGIRYNLVYADGSEKSVELSNMLDYEHVFNWGFAGRRNAVFARNWKMQGGWDGGAPILNIYAIECEDKELRELQVRDLGEGPGFMILAVTAEVAGPRKETAVAERSFSDKATALRAWSAETGDGWITHSGSVDYRGGASSKGAATYRMSMADGRYTVELEMGQGGTPGPLNIRTNGRRALSGYLSTSGSVPGVSAKPEMIRLPVEVEDGLLDLTLESDISVGNWRHPSRKARYWNLQAIRVFESETAPPPPPEEIVYGWAGAEPEMVVTRNDLASTKSALLQNCARSRDRRGEFVAETAPGEYDVELVFGARREHPREGRISMHVTLQGRRILSDFAGGTFRAPVRRVFPATVGADGALRIVFEAAEEGAEWGVSAMILRKKQHQERPARESSASALDESPRSKVPAAWAGKCAAGFSHVGHRAGVRKC